MDEILIYTDTVDNHLKVLEFVFFRMNKFKIYLNKNLSFFLTKSVVIHDRLVTSDGITIPPHRVTELSNTAPPLNKYDLISFLVASNVYRNFIADYDVLVEPFYYLVGRLGSWCWPTEHAILFNELKGRIKNSRFLTFKGPASLNKIDKRDRVDKIDLYRCHL